MQGVIGHARLLSRRGHRHYSNTHGSIDRVGRGRTTLVFKLALVQMRVGADKAENLRHARELIQQAAANKADIVALPVRTPCVPRRFCAWV